MFIPVKTLKKKSPRVACRMPSRKNNKKGTNVDSLLNAPYYTVSTESMSTSFLSRPHRIAMMHLLPSVVAEQNPWIVEGVFLLDSIF